jgi:hypothetical protein
LYGVLGIQIKPEELCNYNEINIFDIYMWLDKVVYKINFTENKALIMNWLIQPLKDLKLTMISSKIRYRHQCTLPEWTVWKKGLTHYEYLQNVILNQSDFSDCYKAVLRQTCFIHNCNTAKYLYDLKTSKIFSINGNLSDLMNEKSFISNEIAKQQQHIDNLIKAFHLVGIYEAPRMIHAEYAVRQMETKKFNF